MNIKNIFRKNSNLTTEELIRKKTIISFFFFFVFTGIAFAGWKWLRNRPTDSGKTSAPIRSVLNANENIFSAIFSGKHLAKEYSKSKAANPARVNGDLGLRSPVDYENFRMNVIRAKGDTLRITLNQLRILPKTEVCFNFKCIEGWSQVTWWGGVKFSDFMKAYHLDEESAMKFLGLATPDKEYYVGIDMPSAMHPQTLICYELNGKPLPLNQGYPVRLIIPVKYGVKSLKRIGYMYFDNKKTPDYWADKKGYDYYTGL